MMRRCKVGLSVVAGIAVVLSSWPARAAEPACSRVGIETDGSLGKVELSKRVREAFEARADIDRCARIVLTLGDRGIDVEVTLADGRSARRTVSTPEDVVPVLEALLIVPQASPDPNRTDSGPSASAASAPPTESAAVRPPDPTPAPTVLVMPVREAPASTPVQPSSHLRIELSVLTGARIGDGQASVGLGALSFLDVSGWLLGFAGRADRYRMISGGDSGSALELAVLGGRRLRLENVAVDLFGGLAAALQGTSSFESQAMNYNQANNSNPQGSGGNGCTATPGGCVVSATSSSTVPRLLLGARLSFGARSTLRTFVGVDGDFGPARAGGAEGIPGAPRLPVWTLGLALGATVGTP